MSKLQIKQALLEAEGDAFKASVILAAGRRCSPKNTSEKIEVEDDFSTFDTLFRATEAKVNSFKSDLETRDGDYLIFRNKLKAINEARRVEIQQIKDDPRSRELDYSGNERDSKWYYTELQLIGERSDALKRQLKAEDESLSAIEDQRVKGLIKGVFAGLEELTGMVERTRNTMSQTEWLSSEWSEKKYALYSMILATQQIHSGHSSSTLTYHDHALPGFHYFAIGKLDNLADRLGPRTHLDSFGPMRNYSDRISIDFYGNPQTVEWHPQQRRQRVAFTGNPRHGVLEYYNDDFVRQLKTGKFALSIAMSSELFRQMVDKSLKRSPGEKKLVGIIESVLRARMPTKGGLISHPTAIVVDEVLYSISMPYKNSALEVSPTSLRVIDLSDPPTDSPFEFIPLSFGKIEWDWWYRVFTQIGTGVLPGETKYQAEKEAEYERERAVAMENIKLKFDQIQRQLDRAPNIPDTAMLWITPMQFTTQWMPKAMPWNQNRFDTSNIVQGYSERTIKTVQESTDPLLIVMPWVGYYEPFVEDLETDFGGYIKATLKERTGPTAILVTGVPLKRDVRFLKITDRMSEEDPKAFGLFDFKESDRYIPIFFAASDSGEFHFPAYDDSVWNRLKQWQALLRRKAKDLKLKPEPEPQNEEDEKFSPRSVFRTRNRFIAEQYNKENEGKTFFDTRTIFDEKSLKREALEYYKSLNPDIAEKLRALEAKRLELPWVPEEPLKWFLFSGKKAEFEPGRKLTEQALGSIPRLAIFLEFKSHFPKLLELKANDKTVPALKVKRMMEVLRRRVEAKLERYTAIVLVRTGGPAINFTAPLFLTPSGFVGNDTELELTSLDGVFPVFSAGYGAGVEFPKERSLGLYFKNYLPNTFIPGVEKEAEEEEDVDSSASAVASALLKSDFTAKAAARVLVNNFVAF